jgi:hypothetical protein
LSRYEEAWRIAWTILFLLFVAVVIFSTAERNHVIVYDGHSESGLGELLLVSATLLLTVLAIVLAVAALWGYREIREALITAATKQAAETASSKAASVTETLVPRLVEARLSEQATDSEETANLGTAFPR